MKNIFTLTRVSRQNCTALMAHAHALAASLKKILIINFEIKKKKKGIENQSSEKRFRSKIGEIQKPKNSHSFLTIQTNIPFDKHRTPYFQFFFRFLYLFQEKCILRFYFIFLFLICLPTLYSILVVNGRI